MVKSTGGRLLLALVSATAFAILIGLGTWQLQRLAWKEGLIEAATQRPIAESVPAPGPSTWQTFDIEAWNYRRVSLTGTFGGKEAHSWIVLSDARGPLSGPGYFVVAPFTTTDGWSVLINRGYVPENSKAPSARPGSEPPAGEVTIEGLVRRDDVPSFITPSPDERTNTWFSRDIGTMASFLEIQRALVAPYTVDLVKEATPASGLPQAGESKLTFSNNHLQYALTWYGLAAALAGVFVVAIWPRRRHSTD